MAENKNVRKRPFMTGTFKNPRSTDSDHFLCIRDFPFLSGRRKQEIVIGDAADARVARFFWKSRVKNNWPSQWHQKFPKGYIRFENGKIFDLNDETIDGEKVFIFDLFKIKEIYEKYELISQIQQAICVAPQRDRDCMADLAVEAAGLPTRGSVYWPMLKEADETLSAGLVGLPQLKGLLSLFQMA